LFNNYVPDLTLKGIYYYMMSEKGELKWNF
jgi:hypothetical protein